MRKFGAAGLVFWFVIGMAGLGLAPLDAQAQLRVGLQGMYTSGSVATVDRAFGLGGRLIVEVPRYPIEVHGIFDYHFPSCPSGADNCKSWTAVANVAYRGGGGPYYIGGGASLHHKDFTQAADEESGVVEDWGVNVVIGLLLPVLPLLDPLIELRYEIYDTVQDQFVISLGLVL